MADDEPVGGLEPQPAEGEPTPVSAATEPGVEASPPTLIGGKFKTVEEAVNAYQSAERNMHSATTVNSRLKQQLKDWGCTVDEETGEITLPSQLTQQPQPQPAGQQPPDVEDPKEAFINKLLTEPYTALAEFYGGARQVQKQAEANTKREIGKLKSHPLFAKVADQLDADLSEVPDHYLANPQQATAIVSAKFETAVGRYALEHSKKATTDPVARTEMIQSLGLAEPAAPPDPEGGRTITTEDDREMLSAMGYSAKEQEEIVRRTKQRMKEERNARET